MVLTIFFLSWLFTLREVSYWKTVKNEVYLEIQGDLGTIFTGILFIVENGLQTQISIMEKADTAFAELCKLKDAKEIRLDATMLRIHFEDIHFPEYFLRVAGRLSDIQNKYYRFLSPELTTSLIIIQRDIRLLGKAFELYFTAKAMDTQFPKKIPMEELQRVWVNKPICMSIKGLVEEICKIHKMGIEFSFP